MSYLEQLGLETLIERVVSDVVGQVNAHTTAEVERLIMATVEQVNASLDALAADVATQLEQTRSALTDLTTAVADNTAAQDALAQVNAGLDAIDARVQGFSSDLKADDPAAEPVVPDAVTGVDEGSQPA